MKNSVPKRNREVLLVIVKVSFMHFFFRKPLHINSHRVAKKYPFCSFCAFLAFAVFAYFVFKSVFEKRNVFYCVHRHGIGEHTE